MIGNSSLFAIRKTICIHQVTNVTIDNLNACLLCSPCERRRMLLFIQLSIRRFSIKPTMCCISFCSRFSLKPCTDLIVFIILMILWTKLWCCPLSLYFSSSESHIHSSKLNNICTILILNFSSTFILTSWIHVACFSGLLKIGIAWCKNVILSRKLESFLIFLNKSLSVCT